VIRSSSMGSRIGVDTHKHCPTMLDMNNTMRRLAAERPLFHSEADFQHALAWKIHELAPHAQVRLEVSSGRFDKRERIDILVRMGDQTHAIELKYKKRKLECEWAGEKFMLANDGAQDIGRYDFIKDITRLEQFVSSEANVTGHAILLTNDELYWRESVRGISSAAFFLHEGRVIDSSVPLAWHESTGEGTKKGRTEAFKLRINRTVSWINYSALPTRANGVFRYLSLKVTNSV
jgi:hypothetical protein